MNLSAHSQRIFALAIPMIVSNVTTPLIGLVDTAVIGHMNDVGFLAGVALGALILTQIYWVCGFLRMSSTGLSAQAKGQNDNEASAQILWQSGGIGLVIGALIIALQGPLLSAGLWLAEATPGISDSAKVYFDIRVWSAPFALCNLALIGWLVGQQAHRRIMRIQIVANLVNVVLDLLLVYVFDYGIAGVAIASVVAEISIFVLALNVALQTSPIHFRLAYLNAGVLQALVSLNSHMLVRNLALQICLAFVTYKGTAMGELEGATNAIILQFFTLIALGLDGLAYATEALVGQAKGQKEARSIIGIVKVAMAWSCLLALGYSCVFGFFGHAIVSLLTDMPLLRESVSGYLIVVVLLPLVAHWCFLMDGVYIGLANAKVMRNSMLVCAALFFFPTWAMLSVFQNKGLWASFLIFLGLRGVTLGGHFLMMAKQGHFRA